MGSGAGLSFERRKQSEPGSFTGAMLSVCNSGQSACLYVRISPPLQQFSNPFFVGGKNL